MYKNNMENLLFKIATIYQNFILYFCAIFADKGNQ